MMKRALYTALLGAMLFAPALVLGQTDQKQVASCFDYYKFQSVEIDLHGEKQIYKAGETAKFIGFLTNKNSYPLVGGSLILRISKLDPRSQAGNGIIEEWVAGRDINLRAGEKQFFSASYLLPSGLPTGTYVLNSYFLTQDKFNLSGLSFTDDIFGGYATFAVEGKSAKSLKFARDGVLVNSEPYRIFGFLPKIFPIGLKSSSITIPLKNETPNAMRVALSYRLYSWDGADESNLLNAWEESVILKGNSSRPVTAAVEMNEEPVYFLKILAQGAGGHQSEIHVRIVKNEFKPRLNYVGITKFPLVSGEGATLFACYHNTTGDVSGKGKLELRLKNSRGRVLESAVYEGIMTGNIDVLSKELKSRSLDNLTLSASIYDEAGNLIEEVNIPYDCSRFSESLCLKSKVNLYLLLAGIIIIAAALYFLLKHFKKEDNPI